MGLSAGARTREARLAVDDLDILQVHNRHGGEVARREKCLHVMMVRACVCACVCALSNEFSAPRWCAKSARRASRRSHRRTHSCVAANKRNRNAAGFLVNSGTGASTSRTAVAGAASGGRRVGENKLLTKGRFSPLISRCKLCGQGASQERASFCQSACM